MLNKFNPDTTPTPLTETSRSLADLLVNYLEQLGVEFVFGIPGGAIEPFYNALAHSEQRASLRPITSRHESGAAFMAEGYYSHSGKLGVCCVTTGPGLTNILTGVASAYTNQVPLLVISAQTALPGFGRRAFQESSCTGVNSLALMAPITRFNTLVSHPDQFEPKVVTALMTAFGPIPGPVHLSVPIDVMKHQPPSTAPMYALKPLLPSAPVPDPAQVDNLAQRLQQAKKIVFVIGEGSAAASGTILTTAQLLNAELVSTPHGKGLINPYQPRYRGVVGFAGHTSAVGALTNDDVDTVVCIGTALTEWASNGWDEQALLNRRLIHIDAREQNFSLSPMAALHIRGDIAAVFDGLMAKLTAQIDPARALPTSKTSLTKRQLHFQLDEEAAFLSDQRPIHPARLMRELPRRCPPHTRYLADVGASFAWAIHYLHPYDRRFKGVRTGSSGLFQTSIEFAAMGWAIGCAVGTALALKGQPVVCITGDGSLLMNGQELTVAVQEQLPVIFVVLNDQSLGMVKHGQRLTGAESVGHALPPVNFVDMAHAMGARGFRIDAPADLDVLTQFDLYNLAGPIVLDVLIDPDAVPPITKRTQAIKAAS